MFLYTTIPLFAQYAIKSSNFCSGNREASNANFSIKNSIGQSLIGVTANDNHVQSVGFWYINQFLITSIDFSNSLIPIHFNLHQNYPNPFNPYTTIKYDLPSQEKVEIQIYNSLGQKVKTLISKHQEAGYHEILWDGTSRQGIPMSSGFYFYSIKAGKYRSIKKMILLK